MFGKTKQMAPTRWFQVSRPPAASTFENCIFLTNLAPTSSFSATDRDARIKISHAVRYRKQHKSEQSLLSDAIKRGRQSESDESTSNSTFPRPSRSRTIYTLKPESIGVNEEEETDDEPKKMQATLAIFSDEVLESVVPDGNELPSCTASFEFYVRQDEFGKEGRNKEDDDRGSNPW